MKLPRKIKAMESPLVAKRRGRPRKYRRKEDKTVTVDQNSVSDVKKSVPIVLIGRYILKEFPKGSVLLGKVVSYASGLYRVTYEDDSYDDLNSSKIRRLLLDDSYFDDDLTRRKIKLDESILAKIVIESEKYSSELSDDLLIENEEERDVTDVDSLNDSKDSCSDKETPLPLPLPLPPSSGTIGVPEKCVSHLFAVYTFLRSFSTRLFLSPFTLDDFVGALNCRVSNTLLDAIHVSLMRALKRHLENISAAGSRIASKCLRCTEWSLLDTLTWPVYVLQYLAVNGYTIGPEWKGFYDEVFYGEYYLLPANRKLTILQILCDDVLESEELKAEMGMREKSEVGMDYDAEHILPSESGPRRVHPRVAKTAGCKDDKTMDFDSELNTVNLPANSEDAIDNNGDECCLCGMDGTLLCCDGCPATYHSRCIGVLKNSIPQGEWHCPECEINMIGPTISRGTLQGAEIFGNDLYGQLFIGTCDHLVVLNLNRGECWLRYYNQNDIPGVIRLLYASMQHRPLYVGICTAILRYWSIAESFLDHCVPNGTHVNSENTKISYNLSAALLPAVVEDEFRAVSLGKAECSLTSVSGICSDDRVPSLDSLLVTSSPACEVSGNAKANVNMKLRGETVTDSIVSTVNQQSDTSCPNPGNKSTAADPAKHSLVSSQFINYGHASDMGLPMNLSLQTQGDKTGFGKCKGNITNDFVYMGCTFKPQSYINNYMHGDFAASAAANLAILSSEDSRSEGLVLDNWRKATSGYTYLMAKAFSQTVSRFFWPCSDKKRPEVPRERCGWCLSCKAPVSSKKGCMLNHAALSGKSTMKFFPGLVTVRSGEGIIASIASYVIFMEESLRGLIDGPFLIDNYRQLWRKQVEKATSFSDIKPLLLKLEENIRIIAFSGDWAKLMDDWLVQSLTILSATSTLGTTQKRTPFGRSRKQLSIKVTAKSRHQNFAWWNGDKFTKSIFQRAVLPKSTVRKAARQGGLKKILGIFYPDGSEIPKRSRRLIWRAAVQMSRNASQLALQVRYLDFHIRWIDLIRPEHSFQDGKGQDTEASAFRNANICDRKLAEGNFFYGIAFGSQKHLPRVMKNVEIEQGPEGKKYWFLETRIPLYLVKEYEVSNGEAPSQNEFSIIASQLHRKRLKAICKDIFFYLTCKRDKLEVLSCSVCQLDVLFRYALKCSECQGYCHPGCSPSSTHPACKEVEFLATCKQCYYTKLVAHKGTSNKPPTTPLLLKGQEHSSLTFLEGPRPKCDDQVVTLAREKGKRPDRKQVASVSPLEAKSHRKNSTWGVIWKKKNIEDTGIDFRLKNILLKRHSSLPQLEPVCRLCQKPYRSDLMYICCETCRNWYHAEAVELEESKIFNVLGFKCCKCRKIKSPVCPYSDLMCNEQHGTKSHSRSFKNEHSGRTCSNSEILTDMRACELATPICPAEDVFRQENNPLLFSLSNVEMITEPKLDAGVECNAAVSGDNNGIHKSPAKTYVKPDGDNNGSFGGEVMHDEFSTGDELDNLPEIDSALLADCNLLNNSDIVNNEYMDFDPNTDFSMTELDCQFEEADVFGDLSEYAKNSCTFGFPEECTTASLTQNWGPTVSSHGNINNCSQCSLTEPVPDLFCQICGMWIHNKCSPWIESPSRLIGGWKCGNCREWR